MAGILTLSGAGNAGTVAVPFGSPYSGTLVAWYDCYQESFADGDPVDRMTDWHFSAGDVTAAGTARPTFKTNQVNTRPALLFDGTTDILQNASFLPSLTTGLTIMAVVSAAPGGNYGQMVATSASAGAIVNEVRMAAATSYGQFASMAGVSPAQDGAHQLGSTGWRMVIGRRDNSGGGTNGFTLVPNAEATTSEAGTTLVTSLGIGGRPGGSLFFSGYIAEVLIYGSSLSAGNQTTTINYFKLKYAL
jgi:hypothetical protein